MNHKSSRFQFLVLSLALSLSLSRPVFLSAAPDDENSVLKMRAEELAAKQKRSDELANRVQSMQKLIEADRKETAASQERVWKDFNQGLEVERKNLKDQMSTLEQRQHLFEQE